MKYPLFATMLLAIAMTSSFHLEAHKGETLGSAPQMVTLELQDYYRDMQFLAEAGIDVAGVEISAMLAEVIVSPLELSYIRQYRPSLKVTQLRELGQSLTPDAGYLDYEELTDKLHAIVAQHPQLASLHNIGDSLDGRPIWAVKISDHPNQKEVGEPTILFNAMHHAREVMTTEVAFDTIEFLLTNYEAHDRIRGWVDNNEIWVVPMLNPDGNDKVWSSTSMWRKNTRGGYGVDLNRNYPFNWNSCGGSSGFRYAQTYRGPEPASEPETKALMALVERIKPVFDISYHSFSELVLYPLGCKDKHTTNHEVIKALGYELASLLPSDADPSEAYRAGTPWELLYSADGGDIDWMWGAHQVIPFVIELNARSQGFQPDYDQWREPTVIKARAAWMRLLDRLSGPGIRGRLDHGAEATLTITPLGKDWEPQIYRVNPDGSFHVVLLPGSYQVALNQGDQGKVARTLVIEDRLIDLSF